MATLLTGIEKFTLRGHNRKYDSVYLSNSGSFVYRQGLPASKRLY